MQSRYEEINVFYIFDRERRSNRGRKDYFVIGFFSGFIRLLGSSEYVTKKSKLPMCPGEI